jgi:3-deoxy-D-manno-octulosonic-acid transferase
MALVMETEVWPNMLRACEHRGIPVLLANARLSARSARRYARLGALAGETFRRLSLVGAQSEADAGRFRALGVAAERLHVTGSIKFDLRLPASLRERAEVMRRAWGCDRPVWVAASTHEGEEEQVLEAHRHVMKALPRALLVLVPRHPERFERVAALASRKGFAPVRRSAGGQCRADDGLFLGDTMGELPVFIAAADAAFVGGSLVPAGGHNLLEAAAAGVPAAIGPHVFNFSQITELLVSEGAAVQVSDSRELAAQMTEWLGDAAIRAGVGENGRRVVERNRGAVNRVIDLLESCYPGQEDQ